MRHVITPVNPYSFIGGLSWQAERIGSQISRWVALLTMGLTSLFLCIYWLQGDYQLISVDGAPAGQSFTLYRGIPALGINIQFCTYGVIIDGGINCYFRYFSGALHGAKINHHKGFPFQPPLWILAGVSQGYS